MVKGDPKAIKEATKELSKDLAKTKKKQEGSIAKQALEQGFQVKDVLRLNDTMVEGLYGQAYRLYNSGKYKDAIQIFRLLTMLNASEPKYMMGLGACFHMLKEYEAAVDMYNLCTVIDPYNPIPYYHASDCLIQMEDIPSALVMLEMAHKHAGNKPEFKTIKDRVERTLSGLKKQLNEKKEEKS